MDLDLYDELGNYIGEEDNEDNNNININSDLDFSEKENSSLNEEDEDEEVILYEDKEHYPDMKEIYPEAEILIEEEDNQILEEPIIKEIEKIDFLIKEELKPIYKNQYLIDISGNPNNIYNVCFVGSIHHGKTSLIDEILKPSFENYNNLKKNIRITDNRKDEQEKLISIKTSIFSTLKEDNKGKNYLLNLIDTPGHFDFLDEIEIGLRLTDGVFLVIDVIEGIMLLTEKLIEKILKENLNCVIIFSKLDRLIHELKLPPEDAYLKINFLLEEINDLFLTKNIYLRNKEKYNFNPIKNNVIFISSKYNICFNLFDISKKYDDDEEFINFLWGDFYYDNDKEEFTYEKKEKRTFVEFVLEPIYKIFGFLSSKGKNDVKEFLKKYNIKIEFDYYELETNELISLAFDNFFNNFNSILETIKINFKNSNIGNKNFIEKYLIGNKENINKIINNNELLINIVKFEDNNDFTKFYSIGRILNGNLKEFDKIRIIGEGYQNGIEEENNYKMINKIFLNQCRSKINIKSVNAGNIIYIENIEELFNRSATLLNSNNKENLFFKKINKIENRNIRVAIEPFIPSELSKLLDGINKVLKSYPNLESKVEQTGEYYLNGCGEMYLDCVMDDLRNLYAKIEIRISDPICNFKETILEPSNFISTSKTPNKLNSISVTSEPIEKKLLKELDKGFIQENLDLQKEKLKELKWDNLEIKSIWTFGPLNSLQDNMLIDFTIPNKNNNINLLKDPLIKGFNWAINSGPLIEEPIRGVKFKINDYYLNSEFDNFSLNQFIPTIKTACYSSMMISKPKLLEPINFIEIICTMNSIESVYSVLNKRRGHILNEYPKPGTPLYIVNAKIPVLDSFGFETDLRLYTIGQAFCTQMFSEWDHIPGDPLDKTQIVKILEPSMPNELSREILVKMRKRKGLSDNLNVLKYFEDDQILDFIKQNENYKDLI